VMNLLICEELCASVVNFRVEEMTYDRVHASSLRLRPIILEIPLFVLTDQIKVPKLLKHLMGLLWICEKFTMT
jgi:hypothetical protein